MQATTTQPCIATGLFRIACGQTLSEKIRDVWARPPQTPANVLVYAQFIYDHGEKQSSSGKISALDILSDQYHRTVLPQLIRAFLDISICDVYALIRFLMFEQVSSPLGAPTPRFAPPGPPPGPARSRRDLSPPT